jgi:excisionase family DNA binding protein
MSARCYTVAQLLSVELLNMSRSTFFELKKAGKLPYLEEIKPRSGRRLRFRADLVDRYLAGQYGQPRSFASHRRLAS